MKDNQLPIKLSFIYIALYAAIASFIPYLTPVLQQRGLSYTQIGVAFAVISIISVVSQPVWGFLTDKFFNKRLSLILIVLACSVVIFNFVFATSYVFIIISIIILTSFQSSIFPISDAYTYEIINQHREIQYGRIRLMGSFGYAVGALFVGYLIKIYGINSSYFVYSILMLIGAYLVYTIDFKPTAEVRKASFNDFLELIKDKRFSIFMLSIVIVNIAMGMNGTYIYILIEKTGGDVSNLGILWFTVAISELPTLFFGHKLLNKYGELNLFILGVGLFAVRMFLNSMLGSYQLVILVQFMQSITFAFYLIAALQYINTITSNEVKTSAMTFFAAMCGLGALIGNIGGGILLESISIFTVYRIASVVCLISLIFILMLKKDSKKKPYHKGQTNNKENTADLY